jgi:hypothetical protein
MPLTVLKRSGRNSAEVAGTRGGTTGTITASIQDRLLYGYYLVPTYCTTIATYCTTINSVIPGSSMFWCWRNPLSGSLRRHCVYFRGAATFL